MSQPTNEHVEAECPCCQRHNEQYRNVLQEINYLLKVPAAEYVPAISDVFQLIDRRLKERRLPAIAGKVASAYQHRYRSTVCPECSADLTRPNSVLADFNSGEGPPWSRRLTRLELNGNLQDVDNCIARGWHVHSRCYACDFDLSEIED